MNIEKAFPVCNVEVTLVGADAPPDAYAAVKVEDDALTLEGNPDTLHTFPLQIGQAVEVRSFLADAVYVLPAAVQRCIPGKPSVVTVRQSGPLRRIQRRKHFRVNVAVPLTLTLPAAYAVKPLELTTLDLSGGGFQARSPICVHPPTVGHVVIRFDPAKKPLSCQAEVLRHIDYPEGDFGLCGRFLDITDADRDRLVQFLMNEVRRQKSL